MEWPTLAMTYWSVQFVVRLPNTSWPPSEAAIQSHTMDKQFYVYIMANKRNGTIYIGVTNNLARRVYEHREGLVQGFTSRYGLKMLVYFEVFDSVAPAIQRETSLKRWQRRWKLALIEKTNPHWNDLAEEAVW